MLLKNMVGPCGLEPQTSTVSILQQLRRPRGLPQYAEVAEDIILCGLDCGLEIIPERRISMLLYHKKPVRAFELYESHQSFQT